jgi:colicin import membrane protein
MAATLQRNMARPDLQVQTDAGNLRSFGLSALVHLLLVAALTWGVSWRQQSDTPPVQAELWSAVVMQAAPKAVPTPPVPEPPPEPPQPVVPKVQPKPTPPVAKPEPLIDPQIAIEKEKKLKLQKQREEQERLKAEAKARETEKQEALEAKRLKEEKEKDKKAKADKLKADQEKLAKADAEKAKKDKTKEDAAKAQVAAEKARLESLKRLNSLANATGNENAKGKDLVDAAPSQGYLGRVAARIKPNVAYPGDRSVSITTEVLVYLGQDGRIISARVVKRSGSPAWDDAALRAVEKTEVFPLEGGRVHSPLLIALNPRDY